MRNEGWDTGEVEAHVSPNSKSRRTSRRVLSTTALLATFALLTSACTPGGSEGEPTAAEATPSDISATGTATPTSNATAPQATKSVDTALRQRTVATTPWALAPLDDGRILFTERNTGKIRLLDGDRAVDMGTVPGVDRSTLEGGLLGLALSPDFASDQKIFVYLTTANDNRVVSMTVNLDAPSLSEPTEVLTGIPRAYRHNGGRIKFGPDGMLYIGTGDAEVASSAQDRAALSGKILRVTPEGRPAPGNPFGDSPVYTIGHRNVQGFAWDADGNLWSSEFGPTVDDELNLITPGANYGWPTVTGAPGDLRFQDAKVVWPVTADASPSGIVEQDGRVFVAALMGRRVFEVTLDGSSASLTGDFVADRGERVRDVAIADGLLYFATDNAEASGIYSMGVPE